MLRSAFFLLILAFPAFFSCKNDSGAALATTNAISTDTLSSEPPRREGTMTYTVTSGMLLWTGKKSSGDTHEGTIRVASGELLVRQTELVQGTIQLDMHSLTVTSIKDGGEKRDLESHLKDTDFFEANKYPIATFSFNEVLTGDTGDFNRIIVGNLTMKGRTNPVKVPVQLTISGDELEAQSPEFSINRTDWGIVFRSSLAGTVKNKLIEDKVMLSIRLRARKVK